MAKDATSGGSKFTYQFNPFQDLVDNDIADEIITINNGTGSEYEPILVPRCGPFFANKFKIIVKETNVELKLEEGDYSFVYPYMDFLKDYQSLVYGGILLKNQPKGVNYLISYSTLGGDYVFDDINYAKFVANVINNPRSATWEQLVNLPDEWPSDPHDHPAEITVGYGDFIIWFKSYIDAITSTDVSLTLTKQFQDHIEQTIDKAHGGGLTELGVKNIKDYPLADGTTVAGESSQIYASIWAVKNLIRAFNNGEWK